MSADVRCACVCVRVQWQYGLQKMQKIASVQCIWIKLTLELEPQIIRASLDFCFIVILFIYNANNNINNVMMSIVSLCAFTSCDLQHLCFVMLVYDSFFLQLTTLNF